MLMKKSFALITFLVVTAAQGETPAPSPVTPAPPVVAKVTDKNHPDYVRCKTFSEVGSLVRKIKACRTNAEWKKINAAGNATARAVVEAGTPGGFVQPQ
jgi:Xaa-Pro aminopeptidase